MSIRALPVYGTPEDDVIDRSGVTVGQFVNARDGNDLVIGSAFDDRLYLGSGNDVGEGGGGNDTIVGGDGIDTARYRGSILDFDWAEIRTDIIQITDNNASDGDEGTDTLRGIEYLQFDDFVFNINGDNAPLILAENQTISEDAGVFHFDVSAYDFDGGSAFLYFVSTGPNELGASVIHDLSGTPVASGMGVGNEYTMGYNLGSAYQFLGLGDTYVVDWTFMADDGQGNTSTKSIQMTIEGRNDDPTVAGVIYNETFVEEDGSLVATGLVDASDVDQNDTLSYSVQGGGSGTYGSLTIAADGSWTYTLDNNSAAVQGLNAGDTVQDTFTIEVADGNGGFAYEDVTIDVQGADEAFMMGGSRFDFQYYFPSLQAPYHNGSAAGVYSVEPGVEISPVVDGLGSVDLKEDNFVFLEFDTSVAFANGAFNGFVLNDIFDEVPDIVGVVADTTAADGVPDITYDTNSLYVDLEGQSFLAGDRIEIEILFD